MRALSLSRRLAPAVLSVVLSGLWFLLAPNVERVDKPSCYAIVGGELHKCVTTCSSCPTYGCYYSGPLNDCIQCDQVIATYQCCLGTPDPVKWCQETVNPNDPWCGEAYRGDPVNGACPNGCPNANGNCGKQLPTITGTNC